MSFTDEALERLKRAIKDRLEARAIAGAYELPGLIARLEAAERLIEPSSAYGNDPEYKAWLKVSGKKP